ncbi:MAG TPA: hypothetical protein GX697_03575 [Firmicutes bacterium]|nr:hypothetical protein [Bacillota bacterium]
MQESTKSVILVCMVILSLVLSFNLWFSNPSYEESKYLVSEKIQFTPPRALADIILPEKIVAVSGKGRFNIFYPEQVLYEEAVKKLKEDGDQGLTAFQEVTEEEWLQAIKKPGLLFYYDYPCSIKSVELWEQDKAKKIFLPLGEKEIWLVNPEGGYFMGFLEKGFLSTLFESYFSSGREYDYCILEGDDLPADYNVTIAGEIYLSERETTMMVLPGEKEKLDDERLVKILFADVSKVRRFEEKDGAIIYTDGSRGVRFYPYGAMEYTMASYIGKILTGDEALKTAGELISLYGGWPPNLYFWADRCSSPGQLFFRSYYNGLPLLSSDGCLNLTLTQRGAYSYYRRLIIPSSVPSFQGKIISGKEAVAGAVAYLADKGEPEQGIRLKDLYKGYYLLDGLEEGMELWPTWVVEVDGAGALVMNAFNGKIFQFIDFE